MYGFSTSLAALAFYMVACLSASWLLYSDATTTTSGQSYLYQTWASPYAVCMRVFGATEMKVVDVCKSSLDGGTLAFSSQSTFKFQIAFPFSSDSEISPDDTSRLQTVLACLILATFFASLANGEHWEFAMRRLSGYRAYALLSPVSTPLIAEHHSSYQSHSHQIDMPAPHVAVTLGSEERIMPARVVWTIILANSLSGNFSRVFLFFVCILRSDCVWQFILFDIASGVCGCGLLCVHWHLQGLGLCQCC